MSLNFNLSDEAVMMRDTVRKFAEEIIKPKVRELDKNETFSPQLTREMGKLGLFGFCIPEEYGGNGIGYIPYIIAVEELARVDSSQAATVAAHNSLGIGPLYYYGNQKQKKKYIPKLCTGEYLWGFGLTESEAGSDAGGTKTKAVKKGDKWIINGSKTFITNASTDACLGVTVQATTGTRPDGKKEYTCFIVEKDTPGFEAKTLHDKMVWRSSITSELFFEDVVVPEENILGKQGEGFYQMLDTLDKGRLSIAAMGLGCAQGAFELGLNYARERKQFGKAISNFQANAFKIADMHVEIEAARMLLYRAAWLCDSGNRDYKKFASMAKLYCSEVAHQCVNHGVQLHGGYGLMKEYDIERFFRDQKILEIGEGTSEILRMVIARYLGCFTK